MIDICASMVATTHIMHIKLQPLLQELATERKLTKEAQVLECIYICIHIYKSISTYDYILWMYISYMNFCFYIIVELSL